MESTRQERVLEIFFRALRGEDIVVRELANEYGVSSKSISRNVSDLKAFLADHRELVGNTEFEYSHKDKCYRLYMDEFLTNRELFALVEVMIGARAFLSAASRCSISIKSTSAAAKSIEAGITSTFLN